MVKNEAYQTIAATERHCIGMDGLPASHGTERTVTALQPLDHVTYAFDTNVTNVQAGSGLTVGKTYEHDSGPGIYAVDLHLEEPMAPGETRVLAYDTKFNYTTAPPQELRRFTGSAACSN
jgi:hypothetical protein